ncbi:hypothetical protein AB0M97_27365 [Streptomyces sp. NPDC051207]|uniref:hypothetical protein n=1 Tax=Streptomyces sp. NPDC051207 TaxID=3154641 RepID=UPI00343775EC
MINEWCADQLIRFFDPAHRTDCQSTRASPSRQRQPKLGEPVNGYRADQLGKQAGTDSAILVEGHWHCRPMPDPLINATIELHAERIDRETWISLIGIRRGYRIMLPGNADADGNQRMMCPEAGKAQCPIRPRPLGRDIPVAGFR